MLTLGNSIINNIGNFLRKYNEKNASFISFQRQYIQQQQQAGVQPPTTAQPSFPQVQPGLFSNKITSYLEQNFPSKDQQLHLNNHQQQAQLPVTLKMLP